MDPTGRIEKLNQAVRGVVTLSLCLGFLWLAFVGRISGEVFTAVFTSIIGFWFGTRSAQGGILPPSPTPSDQMRAPGGTP